MTNASKALRWCVLAVSLGALATASAQSPAAKRRVRVDHSAEALNSLLNQAQDAANQKDFATAARKYQEYLSKKPNDAIVHFDLGYVYTAMNRSTDAKTEYEKAISLDPKMGNAYLNLGLTLLESDPNAAVEPLEHAADLMPDQAKPKFLLGTALERSGKPALAIQQYQEAQKLGDTDFELQFALGRVLLSAHRARDAEKAFRAALMQRPDSAEAHLGLGQSLLAEKHYESGAAELAAYLQSHPHDARARVERAAALLELGKNDDALAELDSAAKEGPESMQELNLRAQVYFAKRQYDKAVPVLQKAAALAPQNVNVHALLGHALLETKDYPGAVRELVTAYRMDPSANDILRDLILAQYSAKNCPAALQGLDLLAKREPLPLAGWFVRGACLDQLGQAAQALDAYQKFLQLNKDENSDMYFEAAARSRVLARELRNRK